MKRIVIFLLFSAGALFPSLKLFFRAWMTSPLDKLDGFFLIGAMLCCAFVLFFRPDGSSKKMDFSAVPVVVLSLIGTGGAMYFSINAVRYWMILVFLLSMAWCFWGWRVFWDYLPVGLIAALAVPSSALASVMPSGTFVLYCKLILMSVLFLIALAGKFRDILPTPADGLYYISWGFFVTVSMLLVHDIPNGRGFELRRDLNHFGNYVGASQPLSDLDRRFFTGTRRIERKLYCGPGGGADCLSTLEIVSGKNVHSIHPATVCLRSAGWKILSTEYRLLRIRDTALSVEEILSEHGGRKALYFVWYSNGDFSTGSFFKFRRSWRPDRVWHVYQIKVPVPDAGGTPAAEKILIEFLRTFQNRENASPVDSKTHKR